ncbi:MAG: hypothetical protein ACJA2E_002420 [Arenicella sp.]|jgi:hypothetical protein
MSKEAAIQIIKVDLKLETVMPDAWPHYSPFN